MDRQKLLALMVTISVDEDVVKVIGGLHEDNQVKFTLMSQRNVMRPTKLES